MTPPVLSDEQWLGRAAPDFALDNQFGEHVTLGSLRGGAVALVFYPFAFSGVCTGELAELRDNAALFAGVRLLAVSVDSKYALRSYAREQNFDFELLADFWPHGQVARAFGAFDAERGMATRHTFLLDGGGLIRDHFRSGPGEPRPLSRYRQALERLP